MSKQEIELFKQEMELFLQLSGLWSKNFFYNIFSISTKDFKTGNGIIQTGYGIISLNYRPLTKKLLLQHLLHIYKGIQNWFSKQEMELFKQEMEWFIPFPGLLSKNFFYNIFSIFTKELKMDFLNGKWNYPNSKYSGHFCFLNFSAS